MDLWIVAATAGAGYVAKANYLKNSTSRISDSSLKTHSCELHSHSHPWNLLQQIRDRTCPLCRLASPSETSANFSVKRDYTTAARIKEGELQLQTYENDRFFNLSNELLPEFVMQEVGFFQRLPIDWQLRGRLNGYVLKQQKFLECCHAAELCREPSRLEKCVCNSLPSAETYMEMELETQTQQLIPRKSKQHSEMGQTRLSRSRNLQGFSSDGMLFFFLGITLGMMSNIGDNRKEVDNLHELLQQTENLVHELHDELETKDQLTWKNIGSKSNGDSSYIIPNASSQTQESNKSAKFDSKELEDEKMKNSEAMSRIEAELEAELERLELNMKRSSLGSAYNFFQKDSNLEDFHLDKVNEQPYNLSESDNDLSGTSPAHTRAATGAVSPQELSLRLHGVIQSRLRERITELEAALENTQKRLRAIAMESDRTIISSRDLYWKEKQSSAQIGMNFTDQVSDIDEASYEYSEGYEESVKSGEADEEAAPLDI